MVGNSTVMTPYHPPARPPTPPPPPPPPPPPRACMKTFCLEIHTQSHTTCVWEWVLFTGYSIDNDGVAPDNMRGKETVQPYSVAACQGCGGDGNSRNSRREGMAQEEGREG